MAFVADLGPEWSECDHQRNGGGGHAPRAGLRLGDEVSQDLRGKGGHPIASSDGSVTYFILDSG